MFLASIVSFFVEIASPLFHPINNVALFMFPEISKESFYDILIFCVPMAFLIKLLRVGLNLAILTPISKRCGFQTQSKTRKFAEQMWFFILYSSLVAFALAVLPQEKFFYDTINCWVPFPYEVPAYLKLYYVVEIGFYLAALYDHIFVDSRRNDFMAMLVHHLATIGLMVMSYLNGFTKIGALIVALHDVSDVFVAVTKGTHYLEWEFTSIVAFAGMLISWAITRLYVYPMYLMYSAWFEPDVAGVTVPFHSFYKVLLSILVVLHVYWFYLFVRMAITMLVMGETADDARSDSEDEDYVDVKKKAI